MDLQPSRCEHLVAQAFGCEFMWACICAVSSKSLLYYSLLCSCVYISGHEWKREKGEGGQTKRKERLIGSGGRSHEVVKGNESIPVSVQALSVYNCASVLQRRRNAKEERLKQNTCPCCYSTTIFPPWQSHHWLSQRPPPRQGSAKEKQFFLECEREKGVGGGGNRETKGKSGDIMTRLWCQLK